MYKKRDDYTEAEQRPHEFFEGRYSQLGSTHPHTIEPWHTLIGLQEAWNKPEKAKEWRVELSQTKALTERQSDRRLPLVHQTSA